MAAGYQQCVELQQRRRIGWCGTREVEGSCCQPRRVTHLPCGSARAGVGDQGVTQPLGLALARLEDPRLQVGPHAALVETVEKAAAAKAQRCLQIMLLERPMETCYVGVDVHLEVALHPGRSFYFETGRHLAERLGYPPSELDRIPGPAVDSFAGVGYFFDMAAIAPGETVLDLGSGSGMDSFLAAIATGPEGAVIGGDMTPEQLAKATRMAAGSGLGHGAYREGRIEEPPVDAGSADCVISNGVISLAPDKAAVFAAAAAALRPHGRLAVADIVTASELPAGVTCDASIWASCIGGAMQRERYLDTIERAGFEVLRVRTNDRYRFLSDPAVNATREFGVASVSLLARRRSA